MFRSLVKRLISAAVANDRTWAALDATFLLAARYAAAERDAIEPSRRPAPAEAAPAPPWPDLIVKHGPFRGLRYPEAMAVGSSLFPKLIGSYERELQPTLEALLRQRPAAVLNIGCAEGYYAVGLALRLPAARVFAFDIDPEALRLCRRMAELNGVGPRVVTGARCDAGTIAAFPFPGRSLVLCDCEGCEREVFTAEAVRSLAAHDLLVEVHDFVHPGLSSLLRERFAETHEIASITSIDDGEKARSYDYEELHGYDLKAREALLAEHRPGTMEWLVMSPRADARHRC